MPGFTLSLDCEGLWGMADRGDVVNAGLITDVSLNGAYESILRILRQNNLKATAAFVTCFAAEADLIRDNIAFIERMAALNPAWFTWALPALKRGALDGWSGAALYRSMSVAGHEMAWHGTTHLPLSAQTSSEAVALELELASRLFRELDHEPRTIVFPRNQVGHLRHFQNHGFETYRASQPGGIGNRVLGLLNEWNIFDQCVVDKPCAREGWCVSPAGHFLNWPSGVRALVPVSVTVRRWKSLLRNAAERGGYVHMWFHPHNLVTAPAMATVFEEVMRYTGELVKSGDIVNLTMAEANEHYKIGVPQ
ncbi:MAG: polysaccharide deacetylase family protein [Rhodoferax sp.]|nr:polysaccharide deacetylase family protein [Rhodoferax sp.]